MQFNKVYFSSNKFILFVAQPSIHASTVSAYYTRISSLHITIKVDNKNHRHSTEIL